MLLLPHFTEMAGCQTQWSVVAAHLTLSAELHRTDRSVLCECSPCVLRLPPALGSEAPVLTGFWDPALPGSWDPSLTGFWDSRPHWVLRSRPHWVLRSCSPVFLPPQGLLLLCCCFLFLEGPIAQSQEMLSSLSGLTTDEVYFYPCGFTCLLCVGSTQLSLIPIFCLSSNETSFGVCNRYIKLCAKENSRFSSCEPAPPQERYHYSPRYSNH